MDVWKWSEGQKQEQLGYRMHPNWTLDEKDEGKKNLPHAEEILSLIAVVGGQTNKQTY